MLVSRSLHKSSIRSVVDLGALNLKPDGEPTTQACTVLPSREVAPVASKRTRLE